MSGSFEQVGAFNRIRWPNGAHKEEGCHWMGKMVEWYFDYGQTSYNVIHEECDSGIFTEKHEAKRGLGRTILKVVACVLKALSLLTIAIPLLMLIGKLFYRCDNNFVIKQKIGESEINQDNPELSHDQVYQEFISSEMLSRENLGKWIEDYSARADTISVQTFDDLEKVRILYNQVSDQISRIRRYRQNHSDSLEEIKEFEGIHQKLKDKFKNDPNLLRIVGELQELAKINDSEENFNNYVKAVGILVDLTDLDVSKATGDHNIDVDFYKKAKERIQPTPIRNCGNSCYLNSDLQLILSIPAIRDLLLGDFKQPPVRQQEKDEDKEQYEKYVQNELANFDETKECLNKVKDAFRTFVIAVESKDQETINETAKELRDATYRVGRVDDENSSFKLIEDGPLKEKEQMQAEVFINAMLNAAGYALRTRKHLFGDDEATQELKVCPEVTGQTMIQLPLNEPASDKKPFAHTIQGLIDHQFSPMPVEGRTVDGKEVKKDVELLQEAPDYLFVHVQRFAHSGLVGHKLHDAIVFDNGEQVDFSKAMDKVVTDNDEGPFFYEVLGAVQHHGTIHGGHYTAMVKKGGEWQNCDDEDVDTSFGKSYPVGQKGRANLEKGYIYAFRRIPKGSQQQPALKNRRNKLLTGISGELKIPRTQ